MGMESPENNDPINDYLKVAEQLKREREQENSMPRLSEDEKARVRDEIEKFKIEDQKLIDEIISVNNGAGTEADKQTKIEALERGREAYGSIIFELENKLRRTE